MSLHSPQIVVGIDSERELSVDLGKTQSDLKVLQLLLFVGSDLDEHLLGGKLNRIDGVSLTEVNMDNNVIKADIGALLDLLIGLEVGLKVVF